MKRIMEHTQRKQDGEEDLKIVQQRFPNNIKYQGFSLNLEP